MLTTLPAVLRPGALVAEKEHGGGGASVDGAGHRQGTAAEEGMADVAPVLLNKQDETRFCLATASRHEFSAPIQLGTVGAAPPLDGLGPVQGVAMSLRRQQSPLLAAQATRMHLVLFGMQNRTPGPYLAVTRRTPESYTITETDGMQLVLFGMQNRTPGPYLAVTRRTPESYTITETDGMHLVLFGMQNRTFGPCLAAINRQQAMGEGNSCVLSLSMCSC
jgi:hypothetical protein